MSDTALQAALRRDRLIVICALAVLCALAWAYLLWLADDMQMAGGDMSGWRMIPAGLGIMVPAVAPWSAAEFALVFVMWAVMMVGMMTPSVASTILVYARVGRHAASTDRPLAATAWFADGYLLAWTAFALLATICQWGLDRALLLDSSMASASRLLGGMILIAAGAYQWTPVKAACLARCQSPLLFIQRHGGFRRDPSGSLLLGLRHGVYCVGCCWLLMTLLFVGGVMNVLWIALLAALALVERIAFAGRAVARLSGLVLLGMGISLLVAR